MNAERLDKLFDYLKEDPNDPFNIYAIAIELLDEKPLEALPYFEQLLEKHKDYVGTYYHAAKLYSALGKKGKAEEIFKKGLEIAQAQRNHHAHRELQTAYNEFLFEEE
jgi:tetratricopeptide (TPR) repeat protein